MLEVKTKPAASQTEQLMLGLQIAPPSSAEWGQLIKQEEDTDVPRKEPLGTDPSIKSAQDKMPEADANLASRVASHRVKGAHSCILDYRTRCRRALLKLLKHFNSPL